MSEFQFGGDVVWRPSDEIIAQSRLKKFMDRHGIAGLEELQRRSTEDIEWFWAAVLRELGIEFYSALRAHPRFLPWYRLAALVLRREDEHRP